MLPVLSPRAYPARVTSFARAPFAERKGLGPRLRGNDEWGVGAYFNADGWLGMCFGV